MTEEPRTDRIPVIGAQEVPGLDPAYADLLGEGPQEAGLPRFSAVTPERIEAAFEHAAGYQLEAISRLTALSEAPTFANTDVRFEESGLPLRRLQALIRLMISALAGSDVRDMWKRLAPRLAAHENAVYLDTALYARLRAVPTGDLTPADSFVHAHTLQEFELAGAALDPEARARVAELRVRIADLEAAFGAAVQRQQHARALVTDDATELEGLSAEELAAAEESVGEPDAGTARRWRLPLVNTSQQPALASLTRPETRRRLMELSLGRGIDGGPDDTRALITELTAARADLAGELGFGCFADLSTHAACAKTTAAAGDLLAQVLGPAIGKAARELRTLAEFGVAEGLIEPPGPAEPDPEQDADPGGAPDLHPADVTFLLHAYQQHTFHLDPAELAPYFELETVFADGVLYAASRLYGIGFRERDDLELYHPDVRAYEVTDADGAPLGLLLADFFARPEKIGGAWMDQLVDQGRLTGTRPVVTLTCNITKPAPGQPATLSVDEVTTLFHEFGHVLHGLFSDVTFPSRSGTNVPRDAVEYPSQLNEMWQFDPEIVANYAWDRVRQSGIPAELLDRIRQSHRFGEGVRTLEFAAAVLLDLTWHSLEPGEAIEDVVAFEQEVFHSAGIPAAVVPPRYRSAYFRHVFTGSYPAGYYSYLWSEVLAADTAAWFSERGGLDQDLGEQFRSTVLAPGGTRDMEDSFALLRGRPAIVRPLLLKRGLIEEE
ncbi:M3 family metallopeptidase [Sediminivirga luteola]|uniref:M3 family metallopeptidase n=1 Tax=Sediminivirga luteola TaxID=1774748 RepID=UPI001F58DEA6|nr:M3 family metallopeptidase [Sediminivirga luteola]